MCNDCDALLEHGPEEVCRCVTQVFQLRAARLCRGRVPVLHADLKAGFEDTEHWYWNSEFCSAVLGHVFFFFFPSPSTFSAPWEMVNYSQRQKKKYNKLNNDDREGGREKDAVEISRWKMKGGGGLFAFCFSKDKVWLASARDPE